MSDYRNLNDPMGRDARYDPDARGLGSSWGWIAAAMFLVVVVAIAFGVGHEPGGNASNNIAPPASQMAPRTAANPAHPGNPAPPLSPAAPAPMTAPAPQGTNVPNQ